MEKYEKLLNMIMEFNPLVRFAAVTDADGEILWHSVRNDVKNIVPLDKTKKTIRRAAKSWKEREEIAEIAGRGMYTISAYENIKRITIPVDKKYLLFISTDNKPEKDGNYGKLANMGAIMSIVDFVTSSK